MNQAPPLERARPVGSAGDRHRPAGTAVVAKVGVRAGTTAPEEVESAIVTAVVADGDVSPADLADTRELKRATTDEGTTGVGVGRRSSGSWSRRRFA